MSSTYRPHSPEESAAHDFTQMLAPVRAAFIASLPEHIEAFENYCNLEARAARLEVADTLTRRAHRIFGVAETLSFPKLGRTALKLEVEMSNDDTGTDLSQLAGELVSEMYHALNS
ncbi:Hpt domain-containing protein [Vannielia litorea]|uniref:Hpt domain-containing protein n=1 Tax=Vannielia litorea TaxID=1217970 RepID=UPI001BD09E66|nr:Hpt domain-containing protein [Vannielia litorea]MBS8225933.1 hypothetical protein [Vannielia litorea]